MMDGDFRQFVMLSMAQRYMAGCSAYIVMYEAVAFIEFSIQDEVDVGIHQAEGKDDHAVSPDSDIDAVHPGDEIFIVEEHFVDGISVGTEMPAVFDSNLLSFGERDVKPQVGNDLPEQFLIYLHLKSGAAYGCSLTKIIHQRPLVKYFLPH